MKNKIFGFAGLIAICVLLLGWQTNVARNTSKQIYPDTVSFHYIAMASMGEKIEYFDWKTPRKIEGVVGFCFLNDSLMFKFIKSNDGKIWIDSIRKVTKQLAGIANLKPSVGTHKLMGVFQYDRHPKDMHTVFYYDSTQKSMIEELHSFTLNRISSVILFSKKQHNPFAISPEVFKILQTKDDTFHVEIKEDIIIKRQ